jgi:hypothetical protein
MNGDLVPELPRMRGEHKRVRSNDLVVAVVDLRALSSYEPKPPDAVKKCECFTFRAP